MDVRENAQRVVDYIGKAVGIEGLRFDENGTASFVIEDEIICTFFVDEDEEVLVVALYLGRIDRSNTELLYEMLCGNYMGAYTGGGAMGIDDEEDLVAIHRVFPLPIEEPAWIEEPLASLIGAARYWRGKMRDAATGREEGLAIPDNHIIRG
ncbi:molecular chaperone Tir [Thermodesulfomicrobium sp. WS]|uniref:type III secretion system chaperone n=1 Tax=Thermodesulfomicrobium sp. WS TaxID=3004129 RepID=UPI002492DB2E|nr:type III secretion system chaperone [Thermodesulfomicrobium sp. WS]BDV01930.1 molecular chaperone Tir [Thermodesulfomicrobium sp. WS]